MDVVESADAAVSAESLGAPVRGSFNLRSFSTDAIIVVGAAFIANAFSYVFHFVLSRRLGPDQYGSLTTMLAIAAILGVLGTSIGTVAMQQTARMWAGHHDRRVAPFLRQMGILIAGLAICVALVLAFASIPFKPYVHIVNAVLWWILAGYVGVVIFAGFARGAAQGAHRFGLFATSLITEGLTKLIFGVLFVALGYGLAGVLGGLVCAVALGITIVFTPMSLHFGKERREVHERLAVREHLQFGGETLRVLAVAAASSALLYIDMVFAKHHFSGVEAGLFGAAGTVARTIPYGVSLIGLILMPKAAAAQHASRESLSRILLFTAVAALSLAACSLLVIAIFPRPLINITYGSHFLGAVPILRIYAIDETLFALYGLGISYLIAIARYEVFWLLFAGVLVEATAMAIFGSTPVRLLTIAIIINALLLPAVWMLALRSLRAAPQAANLGRAELAPEPSPTKGPEPA